MINSNKFNTGFRALLTAVLCGIFIVGCISSIYVYFSKSQIKIEALGTYNENALGNEIWINSISYENGFLEKEINIESRDWIQSSNGIGWNYTIENSKKLLVRVPGYAMLFSNGNLRIKLEQSVYRGIANITYEDFTKTVDCFSAVEVPQYIYVDIPIHNTCYIWWLLWLSITGIFFFFSYKSMKNCEEDKHNNRIIWIDILKAVSVICVVFLHRKGSVLWDLNNSNWFKEVFFESGPRFAVPCFMMVSGYFALMKKRDIKKNIKVTLRLIVITFTWTFIYALWDNLSGNSNYIFRNVLLGNSAPMLWYMYGLIAVYILSPIISYGVQNLTKETSEYVMGAVIFVFLIDYIMRCVTWGEQCLTVAGWKQVSLADFIIFIFGAIFINYILKNSSIFTTVWAGIVYSIIGYALIVIPTIIVSMKKGSFFSDFQYQNTLGALLFGCGVILIIKNSEEVIEKIKIHKMLKKIGVLSLGIYCVHNIFLDILMQTGHGGKAGAVLAVIWSIITAVLLSDAPVLKKLFK